MIDDNSNSEFKLLVTVAEYIKNDFVNKNSEWDNSPFKWVLELPSATKGRLGKQLIAAWCAAKGLTINTSGDPDADIVINGHRVEIKFSTMWKSGIYKFQQIRDQNYEYIICLGISPFVAHCWVISKQELRAYVIGHMGQHTGSEGKETSWLEINPENVPKWLRKNGGTLDKAFEKLSKLSRKK